MQSWITEQIRIEQEQRQKQLRKHFPQYAREWFDPAEQLIKLREEYPQLRAAESIDWPALLSGSGLRVLDLGCGSGWLSALLSRFDSVSQIDAVSTQPQELREVVPKVIESLGGKFEKIQTIHGLLTPLPVPEEHYDLVVTSDGLKTFTDLLPILREIRRTLKNSGALLVLNETPIPHANWIQRAQENLNSYTERLASGLFFERESFLSPAAIVEDPHLGRALRSDAHWDWAFRLSGFLARRIETGLHGSNGSSALQLIHYHAQKSSDDLIPEGWCSDADRRILSLVEPFTMTPKERVLCLIQAIEHIVDREIPGAFVECGVWRGGSIMAAALTLLRSGDSSREIYLYDTFDGMSPPTTEDIDSDGKAAAFHLAEQPKDRNNHFWAYAPLEDVKRNVFSTNYPRERFHFVKGKVEDTIPGLVPERIAILRLDTDWYESTKHELVHLYDRLSPGGILILDDYGYWKGAQQAVDEFLAALPNAPEIHRVDDIARYCVKP